MKISIITVCLNEAERIEKTAESVVSQTWSDLEWIVKDGGSTDGTKELLERYSWRMAHWESAPDGGVYHAMNEAARLARGEWLLFLNGGDRLVGPRVLERIAPHLTHGSSDIVVGAHTYVEPDGVTWVTKLPRGLKNDQGLLSKDQLYRRTINHQSAFISRAVFERFGPYDPSFVVLADYDFFVRAMLGGTEFRCVEPVIVEYDRNGLSARMKGSSTVKRESVRVHSRFPALYRLRRTIASFRWVQGCKKVVQQSGTVLRETR